MDLKLRPLHGPLELEGHQDLAEPSLPVRAGPEGEDPLPLVVFRVPEGVPRQTYPAPPGQAGAGEALP